MIQLKDFQKRKKNELIIYIKNTLNTIKVNRENNLKSNHKIGFQSPTGSGKTVMLQEAIRDLIELDDIFITWLAPGNLANQSLKRFRENDLDVIDFSILTVTDKDAIINGEVKIGIINNEKIRQNSNILNRDNEENLNLPYIYKTLQEEGKILIFIVDESHIGSEKVNTNIFKYIEKYSDIKTNVSATLKNTEQYSQYVNVDIEDVKKAGLIKKEVKFNYDFAGHTLDNTSVTDDLLLELSINKIKNLEKLHNKITPLLIIQVQNGYYADTEEEQNLKNKIIKKSNGYIKDKDIKTFLSEKNDIDQTTCLNNSNVKVVITKVAAATG